MSWSLPCGQHWHVTSPPTPRAQAVLDVNGGGAGPSLPGRSRARRPLEHAPAAGRHSRPPSPLPPTLKPGDSRCPKPWGSGHLRPSLGRQPDPRRLLYVQCWVPASCVICRTNRSYFSKEARGTHQPRWPPRTRPGLCPTHAPVFWSPRARLPQCFPRPLPGGTHPQLSQATTSSRQASLTSLPQAVLHPPVLGTPPDTGWPWLSAFCKPSWRSAKSWGADRPSATAYS